MSELPILTALSLPAVTTFPAADCIQWSDDGQAVLLSANAIFILAPDPGINVETSAMIKQSLDKSAASTSYQQVGWFRTMIEWDKAFEIHQWAAECGEWGTVALGSLDLSFTGVTCSPSNLTSNAGCVYAVLNSNAEVFIFSAVKNYLTGKWSKVTDLLAPLRDMVAAQSLETPFQNVLHMQSTCLAWSEQPNFGLSPAPSIDGSLLAVGNRAGHICLFRYVCDIEHEDSTQFVASIEIAERWITHLAWSHWRSTQTGQSIAYLACSIADGSVALLKITHTLSPAPSKPAFMDEYQLRVSHETLDNPYEADKRGVTSLKWVEPPNQYPILIFTKPGTLHLWSAPTARPGSCGLRTIFIQTQKLSVGSSSLSPISGITYARSQDALVISLADGSFHVVVNVLSDPSLSADASDIGLTSSAMSMTARADFVKVEEEAMHKADVNATHGMSSYDEDSFYLWIHEASRPHDFNYKHDAKHTSMFVVAQLWNGGTDEYLSKLLEDTILGSKAFTGEAPISVLRPILLHIQNTDIFSRLHPQLLEILQRHDHPDDSAVILLPTWTEGLTSDLRRQFRNSLRAHLFGWDSFLSQRLQISLASFCKKQSEDPAMREKFQDALISTISSLWPRLLRVLIRHIVAVLGVLTPTDVPFVLRVVVQALLPGTPADVAAEAQELSNKVQAAVPADFDVTSSTLGLDELCPACHAQVPLNDITTATCPNGHVWARCSITSFILSTPMVRTCIGCSRKAFLPPRSDSAGQNWLPPAARSWLVEELLHAVRRCFFCGNSFVTLV